MLSDWLPFLIYALFAAVIPASMIAFSFLFATRPSTRTKQRMIPFESGVSAGPPAQDRRFTVFAWSPCAEQVHGHQVETLLL